MTWGAVETCQADDKTFPTVTPHNLRMLGHAKASMTPDVYTDLFDDDLDSVADSLDAAIKSTADSLRTKSGY